MSSYGVLTTGFTRPTLEEIRAELVTAFQDAYGSINTDPESVIGQQIGIQAEREDRIWQAMQAVYQSQYPGSAYGRSLDGAVQLNGITRLPASKTLVNATLIGEVSTAIPSGSQASVAATEALFETTEEITLGATDCAQAQVSVVTVASGATYTITLGSNDYDYVSATDDVEADILQGLADILTASGALDDVTASVASDVLSFYATDRVTVWDLAVSANLQIDQVGQIYEMRAVEAGATQALAQTLTVIETPISGWDAVNNYVDGTVGRDIETDVELRVRRLASLQVLGAATVEAIRSRLIQEVDDVTAAIVLENATDTTDSDGRPPHSFEAIVTGGTQADVAEKLWELKPAGIATYGGITEVITDSQGESQAISFSRPVDAYVWVKVVVTESSEISFPADGATAIKEALVEYGETLTTGNDIIYQALFGPIYSVPGISTVTLTIATSATPTPEPDPGEFVSTNIALGDTSQSQWATSRIEVTFA